MGHTAGIGILDLLDATTTSVDAADMLTEVAGMVATEAIVWAGGSWPKVTAEEEKPERVSQLHCAHIHQPMA